MDSEFIACVKDDGGTFRLQSLSDHLNGTARLAGEFAAAFGNKDWSELLSQ
jgi:hypothetical protein